MLKQLRKKKPPTIKFDAPVVEQITCAACSHVRKQSDHCPDWQCPGCGKAYSKVNSTPEAVKQQRREERQREQRESEEAKQGEIHKNAILSGIIVGATTFSQGIARSVSSCANPSVKTYVAGNPILQIVGAAIIVTSLIYAGYRFLN